MPIIGITGKAGHGKNTVADMICNRLKRTQQLAFAGKVKEVFTVLTGMEYQDTENFKNQFIVGWGMTVRRMLQKIGTEAMRNGLQEDVWVNALFYSLSDYATKTFVITDVRFPNEAEAIEMRKGFVIRVVRPGYDSGTPEHESETALDDQKFYTITNDGTLADLEEKVQAMLTFFVFKLI